MNVVDSSGWLEYAANGPNADFFAPAIEDAEHLIVPVVSIYEVFKRILQQRGENAALSMVALMRSGAVIELDETLALSAATLSHKLQLPMADSLILATARAHDATLWTQDKDFEGLEAVNYISA